MNPQELAAGEVRASHRLASIDALRVAGLVPTDRDTPENARRIDEASDWLEPRLSGASTAEIVALYREEIARRPQGRDVRSLAVLARNRIRDLGDLWLDGRIDGDRWRASVAEIWLAVDRIEREGATGLRRLVQDAIEAVWRETVGSYRPVGDVGDPTAQEPPEILAEREACARTIETQYRRESDDLRAADADLDSDRLRSRVRQRDAAAIRARGARR